MYIFQIIVHQNISTDMQARILITNVSHKYSISSTFHFISSEV